MKQIKERLFVALLLSVFIPVVLQAINHGEIGSWMVTRWTFIVGVLTISYLIIEIGKEHLVAGIDKLLGAVMLLVIAALAANFLILATVDIDSPLSIAQQQMLFASIFMMIAASISFLITLFIKSVVHFGERLLKIDIG